MVLQMASQLSSWSGQAFEETEYLPTAGKLEALHTHLVLRFRGMVARHRPGAAFVCPFPDPEEASPNEILVIPLHSGAAGFSIGFPQNTPTTMVVHIGEQGVFTYSADAVSPGSLSATAETLFNIALDGRYREHVWTHTRTGRRVGGHSSFLHGSHGWQEFGPTVQPPASLRLRSHLTLQERTYEPY